MSLLVIGCVPPMDKGNDVVQIDLTNDDLQTIYNKVDRLDIDSLALWTSSNNASARYLISNGFASAKEAGILDSLYKLLDDPNRKVAANAAYAIGQIGDGGSVGVLMEAFINKDSANVSNLVNEKILEAIGKTGDQQLLKSLATVTTYRPRDTLLLLGQSRAIYRYALRGITVPEGTDLMAQYATELRFPQKVRLMGAHYLQRAPDISIDNAQFRIIEAIKSEPDVDVRMALALSLRKSKDAAILDPMLDLLESENDYRVKVNLLRSLTSQTYISAIEPMLANLGHKNPAISSTAASYLIDYGNSSDASIYRNFIADTLHYNVKAKLYGSILKHLPGFYARTKSIISNEVVNLMSSASNPYEKAAYLDALAYNPQNYLLLKEHGFSGHPVLKSTAMNGLARILDDPQFDRIFGNRARRSRNEILNLIKEGIQSGDAGMMAIGGSILKNPEQDFEIFESDFRFLDSALQSLELPREIETYNEIGAALARFNGQPYTPKNIEYNHPIDWSLLSEVSDTTIANIRTDKGIIKIQFYLDDAPGSVINFVKLSKDGFYNGKVFHRVVPNFVVQAGCPRGDGYGSLDYSIRSELPALYYDDEGYIGMASAGNHTEGTQWFITHSPTPHLDGNYTIFGKVVDGMNVVHEIEVGDVIQEIILSNR